MQYDCDFEPGLSPGEVGSFYYTGPSGTSPGDLEQVALAELAAEFPECGLRSAIGDDGSVRVTVFGAPLVV